MNRNIRQRRIRGNRRSLYNRRFYRGNYYFRRHGEQARYCKLVTNKNTLKKVINADIPIHVFNNQYSFSTNTLTTTSYAQYYDSLEFEDCAKLYQQFRVVGVKVNVYRVGQPVLLTQTSTNHIWGLLGFRAGITEANQQTPQTEDSDNTFWVSYLGSWMTYSKFFSFNSNVAGNNMTQWNSVVARNKMVYFSIATKGEVTVPNEYTIYNLSVQYMVEFSNPN